jgi:hypothetical protein
MRDAAGTLLESHSRAFVSIREFFQTEPLHFCPVLDSAARRVSIPGMGRNKIIKVASITGFVLAEIYMVFTCRRRRFLKSRARRSRVRARSR